MNRVLSAIFALTIGSALVTPIYHTGEDDNKDAPKNSWVSHEHSETGARLSSEDFDEGILFGDELIFPNVKSAEKLEQETRKIAVRFSINTYDSDNHSKANGYHRTYIGMWINNRTAAAKNLQKTIMQHAKNNSDVFGNLCFNADSIAMPNYGAAPSTYSVKKGKSTAEYAQRTVYTIKNAT